MIKDALMSKYKAPFIMCNLFGDHLNTMGSREKWRITGLTAIHNKDSVTIAFRELAENLRRKRFEPH